MKGKYKWTSIPKFVTCFSICSPQQQTVALSKYYSQYIGMAELLKFEYQKFQFSVQYHRPSNDVHVNYSVHVTI